MDVDRLSVGDLMMLWSESADAPEHIAFAGILAGVDPPGIDAARESIRARLAGTPSLRWRLRWTRPGQGRPVWVDDAEFDLDRHVVAVRLTPGQAHSFPSWAATFAAEPLDRSHPLWRLAVATGLPGGRCGVVFVAHHAVADGIEAARLVGALMGGQTRPAAPWRPRPQPTGWQLVRDACGRRAAGWWRLAQSAVRGRGTGERRTGELRDGLRALRPRAAELGLPGPADPRRCLRLYSRPVPAVQAAAHARGVSVNDLLLAAVAAGMHRFLASRGVDPDGLSLRVSIPIGSAPGEHNTAGIPIVIDLPLTGPGRSALPFVAAQTRAAKAVRRPGVPGVTASEVVPRSLVRLTMAWLRRHVGGRINLYVTNVRGPVEPLRLAGAVLESAFAIPPLTADVPLAVGVLSYRDTVSVSVNAHPSLDPEELVDGLRAELDRLAPQDPPRRPVTSDGVAPRGGHDHDG